MTDKSGIIEEIDGNNLKISGKMYFALPAIRGFLKNFPVGDTVEFSTSKNDKAAISSIKAGHVEASKVPKGNDPGTGIVPPNPVIPKEQERPAPGNLWPEYPRELLRGKTWEQQVEWARSLLKDPHGVPDRYLVHAKEIIKEESQQVAGAEFKVEKKPDQTAAKADNSAPTAGKVESLMAPTQSKTPPAPPKQERDPREVREVRQSCLKAAVEVLKDRKDEAILQLAELMEAWVWR